MEKCWANSLGNCDKKISGEHLISGSILESNITIVGFPWCKDSPKTIGSASLRSNILCTKHNSDLSDCDNEILTFKKANNEFNRRMDIFIKHGFQKKKTPIIYNINGNLLEKWFCKTLINISLLDKANPINNIAELVPYIFQDKPFVKPFGLNAAFKINQLIKHTDTAEIGLVALYNKHESGKVELMGGLFTFQGLYFILLLPHSHAPFRNNKLHLNLSNPELVENWNNLDLIWHHEKFNQTKKIGRKTYELQAIKIIWE